MKNCLVALLSFCLPLVTLSQTDNKTKAVQFINWLKDDKADSAVTVVAPEAADKINAPVLQGVWQQITGAYGKCESASSNSTANDANIMVDATFAKAILTFSIHFTDKGLVGFFISGSKDRTVAVSSFKEEQKAIAVNGGTIHGTLMLPDGSANFPVVLIIAGSGPTDRNGNSIPALSANSALLLAEALAGNGIGSFRYDKRGVGESTQFNPPATTALFGDYISDASGIMKELRKDKRISKLIIAGHSEGSLIGMIAAREESAGKFISICGAGEPIDKTISRQLKQQLPALGNKIDGILDSLHKGHTVKDVPAVLQSIFNPQVQPFLISWMRLDPREEIKKLKMPALIIGGSTDVQVPVADAASLHKALPASQLLIVEGMNHILKAAPADRMSNLATYTQPELPLKPELVDGVVKFVKQ
ncbi:alpha/beta hydrolase [Nostoc ellipsosporum NOK]|nr:alpha/beta hydrolase [Nostoc ellipsosporum NOK]